MPYVTRFDRRGMLRMVEAALDTMSDEEALKVIPVFAEFERRGMLRILESSLDARFGAEALELMPAIAELDDAERYLALNRIIITAATLDEVRRVCAELAAPTSLRKKSGNAKRGSSKWRGQRGGQPRRGKPAGGLLGLSRRGGSVFA
jgi:hypothetical protein